VKKVIGMVAGSFDPITKGHAHLIEEAAKLVDELHVVIGINARKKYLFSEDERKQMVRAVIADLSLGGTPVQLHFNKDDLLVQMATKIGATLLIRGLRTTDDYHYESQMAEINRDINPQVQTVFLPTRPELAQVSSSTVKELVGFTDWEHLVLRYVPPVVIEALKSKVGICRG
jgi:pantetheine-phosphate adenylyltransferase